MSVCFRQNPNFEKSGPGSIAVIPSVQEVVNHFIQEVTLWNGSLLFGHTVELNRYGAAVLQSALSPPQKTRYSLDVHFSFLTVRAMQQSLRGASFLCHQPANSKQSSQLDTMIYWVTQKLPQICTVILRVRIGKVSWFAVYICGNFWGTQ